MAKGLVVKSMFSLFKSVIRDLLSHLLDIKSRVLIFLLKNCEELLQCQANNGSVSAYNIFENMTSH